MHTQNDSEWNVFSFIPRLYIVSYLGMILKQTNKQKLNENFT